MLAWSGWNLCYTGSKFCSVRLVLFFLPPIDIFLTGIAQGAGVDVKSVLALNVRTEIAYGMFDDGCTAFSWRNPSASFLAQNWDVS